MRLDPGEDILRNLIDDCYQLAGRRICALQFDDVEISDPTDQLAIHRTWTQNRWAKEIGRPVVTAGKEHAQAIIEAKGMEPAS